MQQIAQNIAPEALTIANTYLKTLDIEATSNELGLDPVYVNSYLRKPEVKSYVNSIFLDQGYLNKFRLSDVLNEIIQTKLDELREAGVSSSKDILDILMFAHKIRMDEIKAENDSEKAKNSIKNQKNVQINNNFGENYSALMDKLLK
jgi:hypothetical protein